jgi:c-di-GMP-binding flagellar brake protein YcgR
MASAKIGKLARGIASALNQYNRRDSYRVHIPGAMPLPPMTLESEAGELHARLLDISRTGAAALLPGHFDASLGSHVPCRIGLPDLQIHTQAEVRSVTQQRDNFRLGLLFSDLSVADHYQIDHSIATLERSLLRGSIYLRK